MLKICLIIYPTSHSEPISISFNLSPPFSLTTLSIKKKNYWYIVWITLACISISGHHAFSKKKILDFFPSRKFSLLCLAFKKLLFFCQYNGSSSWNVGWIMCQFHSKIFIVRPLRLFHIFMHFNFWTLLYSQMINSLYFFLLFQLVFLISQH